jgi:hypothetical protein
MKSILLSKSKYLNGLQCPRYLWIACNDPDKIPEPDAATQNIFEQGHLVGKLAKKLFPEGIDIPTEDFMGNIAMTKELLHERKPLFEAGVLSDRLYSRVDVLNPTGKDEWDIIEVKSSTSVKEVNLHDVSFQKVCCEDSGLKIRRCFLMHINNEYVKNGDIDPEKLFVTEEITAEVSAVYDKVPGRISEMLDVIARPECPDIAIGPQCNSPYDCPLTECWDGLPKHNIFTLYHGGRKSHELYSTGILNITDIPGGYKLSDKQRIQLKCVLSGEPYLDKRAVSQFLSTLEYPLHFLDFETFSTAIPFYDGTRPYQNIPFQFSLHVLGAKESEPEHYAFLAEGNSDPRPGLLARLHKLIGDNGSILAYNKSFEQKVLSELAVAFPEYAGWVDDVISRLVDLIVPFRSFHYYHPLQKGSASLKSVLPAITSQGYDGMTIVKGDDASLAFLRITFKDISPEEAERVRADLLTYCKMDTEGMIWIVDKLTELTG